jgi:small subunit ribosomal protein S2
MSNQTVTNELIAEMAKTGILLGHKKSKTHPRMRPHISSNRNDIELLDPEAVMDSLGKAIEIMKAKLLAGGIFLLVGTSAAAKATIEGFAHGLKMPYVTNRWLGGTMTNFKMISSRLKYYEDLKIKREKGDLAKYTKKEQLQFQKEISKMAKHFDGLTPMIKLPDMVFIVDIKTHDTAVREARTLNIPIVAIIDTNDDPDLVDYPIFANDHNRSSIEWIVERIKEGIRNNG